MENLLDKIAEAPVFRGCQKELLAEVTGVARPSLSRVLSELKAEGVIERTLDGIVLVANQTQH